MSILVPTWILLYISAEQEEQAGEEELHAGGLGGRGHGLNEREMEIEGLWLQSTLLIYLTLYLLLRLSLETPFLPLLQVEPLRLSKSSERVLVFPCCC